VITLGGRLWYRRRRYAAVLVAAAATVVAAVLVMAGALADRAATGSHPHPFGVLLLAVMALFVPFVAWRSWRAGRRAGWTPGPAVVRASTVALLAAVPVAGLLALVWLVVGLASL